MSTHKKHKHESSYWMYGTHAVAAAIANPKRKIIRLVVTNNARNRLKCDDIVVAVREVSQKEMGHLLPGDAVHQGIAALVEPLISPPLQDVLAGDAPLVVLDQITDPHNIGAIMRSAAAFHAAGVILPRSNSPAENAIIAKAASGALDIIPLVYVGNLAETLRKIKKSGYWVVGLDGSAGTDIDRVNPGGKTALVMGAEGKGLRRLTAESCDVLVRLPISERMESLNVSNAAAVALYHVSRSE